MKIQATMKHDFNSNKVHNGDFKAGDKVTLEDVIRCGNCLCVEVLPVQTNPDKHDWRFYCDYGTVESFTTKHCKE